MHLSICRNQAISGSAEDGGADKWSRPIVDFGKRGPTEPSYGCISNDEALSRF
jgi:hypothetical protein